MKRPRRISPPGPRTAEADRRDVRRIVRDVSIHAPQGRGGVRTCQSCAEHHREPCLSGIVPTENTALTAGKGTGRHASCPNDSRLTRQLKILLLISMT